MRQARLLWRSKVFGHHKDPKPKILVATRFGDQKNSVTIPCDNRKTICGPQDMVTKCF
jgi:hypothetical protein